MVQQLAVHTVGGVVTPAQSLLVVVPSDSRLEIEAMVSNRDIGFVHAGQEAEIKVDTFNFTRYGLLHGEVLSVSQDAIIRDRPQDRSSDRALGTQNDSSEPKGQELNYSARISLDRTKMQVDDRIVNLSPGMAVTVEIKTGSRTVLSYLLSPLLRYRQETLARALDGPVAAGKRIQEERIDEGFRKYCSTLFRSRLAVPLLSFCRLLGTGASAVGDCRTRRDGHLVTLHAEGSADLRVQDPIRPESLNLEVRALTWQFREPIATLIMDGKYRSGGTTPDRIGTTSMEAA